MKPTRKAWLVVLAAASALVTWGLIELIRSRQVTPVLASWAVCGVLLVVAGLVLVSAWSVRQYIKGKTKQIDQLRAARTAALAKSASLGGALLTGFYGAQAVIAWLADQPLLHSTRWVASGATLCSLVVAIAGLIAEDFCKLPPPDEAEPLGSPNEPLGRPDEQRGTA